MPATLENNMNMENRDAKQDISRVIIRSPAFAHTHCICQGTCVAGSLLYQRGIFLHSKAETRQLLLCYPSADAKLMLLTSDSAGCTVALSWCSRKGKVHRYLRHFLFAMNYKAEN